MNSIRGPLAKLNRPRTHTPLVRERLFRLLDEALSEHAFVWITGPPGFGKTTLAASYVQARNLGGIWYQVDPGDADPGTFLYYLREAAYRCQENAAATLPLLTPEYAGDIPGFARRWFRELYSAFPQAQCLVLDNFQEIAQDRAFHRMLSAALEEVPEGSRILLVSRLEPPAHYARFIANGAAAVLDWQQLKLTLEETRAIAQYELPVDEAQVARLHALAGGWAAGLRVLLEHLRRCQPDTAPDERDSGRALFDYFADQVFERAPAADRDLLLQLCFLPRVNEELAERLTGSPQAGPLLENLFRRHLFVDCREAVAPGAAPAEPANGESAYELHALFREFLRHRARATFHPERLRRTVRRAAELLQLHGATDAAIEALLDAEDWEPATGLILESAGTLLRQGRWRRLLHWLRALPHQCVARDARLSYWSGVALVGVDPASARHALERAYDLATLGGNTACRIDAAAALIEAVTLEYAQFAALDRWIGVLEQAMAHEIVWPSVDAELRAHTALLSAVPRRQGEKASLQRCVERVLELLSSDADVNLKIAAGTQVLVYASNLGHPDIATRALPLLESLIGHADANPLRQALCAFFLAWAYLNLPDRPRAVQAIARLERMAAQHPLPQIPRFHAIVGLWESMSALRLEEAGRWVAVCEQRMDLARPYEAAALSVARTWAAMADGDARRAMQHAREAIVLYESVGSSWHRLMSRGHLLWAQVEAREFAAARGLVRDARRLAAELRIDLYEPYWHAAEAVMAQREGDAEGFDAALAALFRAARGRGCGFLLRFVLPWMPALCAAALERGIEPDYVQQLVRAWRWPAPSAAVARWPWWIRVRALGSLQVEVDGRVVGREGKAKYRVLEVLKALAALGGRSIAIETLAGLVWPDAEGDAAVASLTTTLHRLRRLLNEEDAVYVHDGKVSLNPRVCWLDTWAFDALVQQALPAEGSPMSAAQLALAEQAIGLYAGDLCVQDSYSWLIAPRVRWRARYVRLVCVAAQHHAAAGDWARAVSTYEAGLDVEPCSEQLYQGLMHCLTHAGLGAQNADVYRRCERLLQSIEARAPSPQTQAVYAGLGHNGTCTDLYPAVPGAP